MNSLDILPVKPPEIKLSKQHRELPESIPDVYKGQLLLVVGVEDGVPINNSSKKK